MNILVNPGHGNAPYILGARIADRLSQKIGKDAKIIIPHTYGQTQESILRKLNLSSEPVLDYILGIISTPMLFNGSYVAHLDQVAREARQTQQHAQHYLERKYGGADIEINIGAKTAPGIRTFYAFPAISSEITSRASKENLSLSKVSLERATDANRHIEEGIEKFFIPSYSTFSYDTQRAGDEREMETPPLETNHKHDRTRLIGEHHYVMLSGTGSEQEYLLEQAAQLKHEGKQVLVPPWAKTNDFKKEDPNIIANKNVQQVIARAGFGTIWLCQNTGTQFQPIPYTNGDDPEIYFNLRTLDSIPSAHATQLQKKQFGTLDGIDYVAEKIYEML